MDAVKTAVIGAGILGEVHARAFANYHRSELRWVCDIDETRARDIAGKFGCEWTTDAAQIAADCQVDAVGVATPDFAHAEAVVMMLEAGKHVLCEKPLATDAAEARKMVETAREKGLKLMVDFQNRWSPIFLEAKKTVESGEFGDFVMGYARLSNTYFVPEEMLSWAGKSGPETFLMPHTLDMVRWLTGREPVEVFARGHRGILEARGIDALDAVQATVAFDGGGFCTFESCWIMPRSLPSGIDFKMSLQGSDGKIEIVGDYQGITVSGRRHRTPAVLPSEFAFGREVGFFHEPLIHFVDCVADDRQPACTGEDGLVAVEVIEAVHESIETGGTVRLEGR